MTAADQQTFDVVLLGGGPAGSAAARMLASWGHSVVVLSRGNVAALHGDALRGSHRDRLRESMAESLPPSAAKLLERVGLKDAVDAAGFVRSTGNSVRWGADGVRAELFGDGGLGWQVRRDRFDEVLLAAARNAGATVRNNASVRRVSDAAADGTREVQFDYDGTHSVRARWVLDCTGRAGVIARRGWRSGDAAARTLAIVGVWEREPPWGLGDETHTVVESYDAGWAWSIPVSPRQRYVTMMVDPAHTRIGSGAELLATYRAALDRTSAIRDLVMHATLLGAPWARESSPYGFSRAGEEGMLLVGDAASFVDPLSSFGVKKALASAWLASIVTRAALRDGSTLSPALQLYELREREMHAELQHQAAALARDAATLHDSGFWSDRAGITNDAGNDLASVSATRAAFDAMRDLPRVAFQRAPSLEFVSLALVSGTDIVVVPHLLARDQHVATPRGVRFIRNVDVVILIELADSVEGVPELFEAYLRRTERSIELSDFLVALSTLVAIGALALLDSPRATP
ncbi:MAG: FAD-dependent monooxygenase [Gemmatimonas sp.]